MSASNVNFLQSVDLPIFLGFDLENCAILSPAEFPQDLVVPQPILLMHMPLH